MNKYYPETMIPFLKPTGSINYKIVLGVYQSRINPNWYYVVDNDYNYFRIEESVYNKLIELNYPIINCKRKGV